MQSRVLGPAALLVLGALALLSAAGAAYVPCADVQMFSGLNHTGLTCAQVEIPSPQTGGAAPASAFTLAWALANQSSVDILRLGLSTPADWAAVAFPKYAYPDEAPTLPGATVLLMSQSPSTGGAAAGGGNGTAGVDVTSWLAAGPAWSDALAPGAGLPYSAVAGGSGPGGGIWAVVDIPDFQNQLASYGTHWPVRFLPMLFALGNTSSAAAAAAVQAADGAAAPTLQPALAGMLTIPMSGGGVEDLVFWNSTAPSNSAASGQARRGVAAAGAAAAAAVHLLLA